jgi:hypothetical protein
VIATSSQQNQSVSRQNRPFSAVHCRRSVKAKPGRRIDLSAVVERVREAEFPRLERRKVGSRRNAPVYYRRGRPAATLELHLPYEVAPSHPLLARRRAAGTEPLSARRAALTEGPPKSPWRRRLLMRPTEGGDAAAAAFRSPGAWWARLRATLAAFVAGR